MNKSNIEQIELEGGNIQTPSLIESFTDEKPKFQCKDYFLTYHIKDDEQFEHAFLRLEQMLIPLCEKYIFAEEYGKSSSTPHIQGAFILQKKQRADKIAKDCFKNGVTLRKLKSWDQAFHYCKKEGNNIVTNIKSKPEKRFLRQDQLNAWELKIDSIISNTEPDDRIIYWFYSVEGNVGKTTFCKFLHNKFDACIIGGKASDSFNCISKYIDGSVDKRAPELVICPIPKSFDMDYLSYQGIEMIKDMFFYSGKYEGGQVNDNSPHLFIFANERPDTSKMMSDRWKIFKIYDNEGNYKEMPVNKK